MSYEQPVVVPQFAQTWQEPLRRVCPPQTSQSGASAESIAGTSSVGRRRAIAAASSPGAASRPFG